MIFFYDSHSDISQINSVVVVNQNVARDFHEFLFSLIFILMISCNYRGLFGDLNTQRTTLLFKIES